MSRTRKFVVAIMTFFIAIFGMLGIWRLNADAEGETAATEIQWPDTMESSVWYSATSIRIPTGFVSKNQADLSPSAEMKAKVKITRGTETFACSHIYEWTGCLTFYFNNSGYNGTSAQKGDVLSVEAGLSVVQNGTTYVNSTAVSWTFSGAIWVKEGVELPDAPTPVTVSAAATVASLYAANFPMRVDVTTNAVSLGGGSVNLNYVSGTHTHVTYTRNGVSSTVGAMHADGSTIRLYFKSVEGLTFTADTSEKGDVLTLGAGFAFTNADKTVDYSVNEDISYIYTGYAWIAGTTLPSSVEAVSVVTTESSYANNGYLMRVDVTTNAVSLGTGADLKCVSAEKAKVTYTRDGVSAPAGVIHGSASTMELYFKNAAGLTFEANVSLPGDIVTIGESFAFTSANGAVNYLVEKDISYIYTTAGTWVAYVPATALSVVGDGLTVEAEKTLQLQATLTPADSTEVIKYESLNPDIATVGVNGLVTGVAEGTAEIKVTAGAFSQTVSVAVTPAAVVYLKTGIVVKTGAEQEFYAGRGSGAYGYVRPTVAYVYSPAKETEEIVPDEKLIVEAGSDYDPMKPGEYTLTVKTLKDDSETEYYSATFKVTVLATTPLVINSVTEKDTVNNANPDTHFYINTDSKNTEVNDAHGSEAMLAYLPYFEFTFPDGVTGNVWACRLNKSVIRVFIKKESGDGNISTIPVGSILTIKKGFGILESEYLAENVSYVYNGSEFVPLVEPTSFTLSVPATTMYVGSVMQLTVTSQEGVNVVYRYTSKDTEIAEIDASGLITAKGAGLAKFVVSYGDMSEQIEVTVRVSETGKTFELVSVVDEYWVPVSTAETPTSFILQGYTLKAHYVYDDGSTSAEFAVANEQIGAVDYTKAGTYELVVSDAASDQTDSVKVVVYEYKAVGTFDNIGVSGYDVYDSRNASGTWNGHMIISIKSYSTNATNLLSQSELNTMASFIEYETADGKVYPSTGADGTKTSSIGLWMLSGNLLVMIRPEGATRNIGYGSEDNWKTEDNQYAHAYVPIYKAGDKITFKKGMPIYAWKGGETDSNQPADEEGYMIVEGYLADDYTYFCYEEDGTKSLWQFYKDYTDFTLSESLTLAVGGAASVGAIRVPSDATTGTFTYVSSDPSVVSVTAQGNMIGESVGTATITVTLKGGKDADGNLLPDIVKTVTVTVKKGISKVEGTFEVTVGSALDLAACEVTVTFTDGTTEKIKLNDSRVVIQDVNTSEVGSTQYNISVTVDGETKRGTITVNVVEKKGCGSAIGGATAAFAAIVLTTAAFAVVGKKKNKEN